MKLVSLTRTAKTYLLTGVLMYSSAAESVAHKISSQKATKSLSSIVSNIAPVAKMKGLAEDAYVTTSKDSRTIERESKAALIETVSVPNKVRLAKRTISKEALRDEANAIGAQHKRPVKRPLPVVDSNGRIMATVKVFPPINNSGPLKGKIVIVNAGHGGYDKTSGLFDPGAAGADINGKIIEEWYKNTNFAEDVTQALREKGAKVIYMQGTAAVVMAAKNKYKYAHAFISLHCDAAGKRYLCGQAVIHRAGDAGDIKLAKAIEKSFNNTIKAKEDARRLGVIKSVPQMPTALVETGFVTNSTDLKNIDSKNYRETFANALSNAVVNFFKSKK